MKLEFGDMIFYSIGGLVVIVLLWIRFVEVYVGLWGAWIAWSFWSTFLCYKYLKARPKRSSSNCLISLSGCPWASSSHLLMI